MNHASISPAAALLALVALVALAGCSPGGNLLNGTHWRLDVWTVSSASPREVAITATFADGRVSGNSGVNTYTGSYKIGPGGAFSTVPLASTQMAGSEQAMRAEAAYLTLLGQAQSFKLTKDRLTLFDQFGNESLNFEPATQ